MAKASDNLFPYVHLVPAAAPSSPAAGAERLFLDSADSNKLKRKNSSGTVTTIEGTGGGGGTANGVYDWLYQTYPERLFTAPGVETRTQGTYAYTADSTLVGGGFIFNSSHTQNDALEFWVWAGAGTYSLYIIGGTDTNRGIETWSIDDGAGTYTTLGTLDWYVPSGTGNNKVGSLTGLSVTGSVARRKLRCKVATKNAASSDYYFSIQQVRLLRTA